MKSQTIKPKLLSLTLMFSIILASFSSYAALLTRSDGSVYDDILNVTWLTDLSFHRENISSTGWEPNDPSYLWTGKDGYITNYQDVDEWVEELEYVGSLDWRLPESSELLSLFNDSLKVSAGNIGPFAGLFLNRGYWTYIPKCGEGLNYVVHIADGEQARKEEVNYCTYNDEGVTGVIILADGDISSVAVPETSTLTLFAVLILALGINTKYQRRQSQ
ncbi:DUF1566 domain-containing protein [Teredinibacter haidensis]|uniref:DUF1566 domain-containing protein n=1 Tax=Teredinibacter haidensis TaxID=2731755 RepID=UPI000948A3B3|nr:DUF1566 domain-containing protein [Teredinibacter haidensis]